MNVATRLRSVRALIMAPTEAFASGSLTGVATGSSLTSTTGAPGVVSPDATETFTIRHPITGVTADLTCSVWRNRVWTTYPTFTVPNGEHWLLDNCAIIPSANSSFGIDYTGSGTDPMSPALILNRCTIDGGSHTDKGLAVHRAWIIGCDIKNCEDAWVGAAYSVAMNNNIVAGRSYGADPHADGIQIMDTGHSVFYHNWISGGTLEAPYNPNSAVRVGNEGGATTDVKFYYNGFGGKPQQTFEIRGDGGGSAINGVYVVGNRWCDDGSGFEYDCQQYPGGGVMFSEWSDNYRGTDGIVGGVLLHAGAVVQKPTGL